ncbi:ABC transporter ATP-binding protein [Sporosarcina sp. E16_3]|uniref:ABC transporter ATP-binding protein n=1 Tax=Sporosarcina sp. E16_3 TaxID=2789293 RepID=UPI001A92099C|nr:ABC transporter ATP-binding protein [Sporosarcina sp. E16_3]MBO0603598.1 ABC transporter ATP-binding protein [Sporosarcina sp. E16_3]
MNKEILKLENISKVFGDGNTENRVLSNISLSIKRGEFVALVGPSGSGKSTLLSIIGALLSPSDGQLFLDNQALHSMTKKQQNQVRAKNIGFIFQASNLISYLNVREQLNLMVAISKLDKEEAKKRIDALLRDLGLHQKEHHYPKELSGGEKQRVAIARAFMNNPSIILADEPTASLDSKRGRQVVEMIATEVQSRNKAALMVTHDERMLDLCDRVYHIEDGNLIERC